MIVQPEHEWQRKVWNIGNRLFDEDLYRQLVRNPQEVIPTMDMAVNEMFFEKYPDTVLSHQVQVRPFNADKTKNMRGLNPEGKRGLKTNFGT